MSKTWLHSSLSEHIVSVWKIMEAYWTRWADEHCVQSLKRCSSGLQLQQSSRIWFWIGFFPSGARCIRFHVAFLAWSRRLSLSYLRNGIPDLSLVWFASVGIDLFMEFAAWRFSSAVIARAIHSCTSRVREVGIMANWWAHDSDFAAFSKVSRRCWLSWYEG